MKSRCKKFIQIVTFLILFLVGTTLVGTSVGEAKGIRVRTRGIGARNLPRRSIADLTKVIQRNPRDANAYISRGMAYHDRDDYDKAIADYTKAIEIKPDSAEAYKFRGMVYSDKGEYDHAILDSTKAIELDPDDADAYMDRGSAYYAKREYDTATYYFADVTGASTQIVEITTHMTEY